jgi:thiol-disulfide isomerase/thioredoxin
MNQTDTKRCGPCDKALAELEKIDDETDDFGVDFVKIGDKKSAKSYGVTTFPTLQYFRNQEPITYDGQFEKKYINMRFCQLIPRIIKIELKETN